MIAIVMCSIFALAITMERLYVLLNTPTPPVDWFEQLREALQGGRRSHALAQCDAGKGPIPRMIRRALATESQAPDLLEQTLEEAAMDELPRIEQHLPWLSTIAQVATLLGLLGTVTGMVRCFRVIEQHAAGANPVNPADLAGGIWEALLTTVAGLEVAIPTILAYNYLSNRATDIRTQMERSATVVVGWFRVGGGVARSGAEVRRGHAASQKTS